MPPRQVGPRPSLDNSDEATDNPNTHDATNVTGQTTAGRTFGARAARWAR
jgi:hypothetical protein